jgi:hypothetical protein
MTQMIADCITARLACLSMGSGNIREGVDLYAFLTDTWIGDGGLLYSWSPGADDGEYYEVMQLLYWTYRRVLWTGADADYNELISRLSDPHFGDYFELGQGTRSYFLTNYAQGIQGFGQFASTARSLLMQLDILATGTKGSEQDNWLWCNRCSGVFFGYGPAVCPAGGSHVPDSNDYVFHYNAPAPPAGTQDGWRYCTKCGVMHFDWGTSACPAGGAHASDGSGNYAICLEPVTVALQQGLSNQVTGFRYCAKCSGLHHNGIPGVCPGNSNGPHIEDGSGNYWVGIIPTLVQR